MTKGTVALPVWKGKKIAWLCMESLCRMNKPVNDWELIVFEEDHIEELGEEFFYSYEQRLAKVGCSMIKYFDSEHKYPLSQKWVMIASQAEATSEYFCLCATDNYYSPFMLQNAERDIKNADWCLTTKGYFYDFNHDKVLRFDYYATIGLQMIAKTNLVRKFPLEAVNKGVDMWFAGNIGNNILINNDHWENVICTNGMNIISIERAEFFTDPAPPYYETKKRLIDLVPIDIYSQMKMLCQKLRLS